MNSLAAAAHGRRICLLELPIVLKLKDNKTENSSGEMQRLQMNLPWECGLISLFNSYLAFSFCHFSVTTLLQLVVSTCVLSIILRYFSHVVWFKESALSLNPFELAFVDLRRHSGKNQYSNTVVFLVSAIKLLLLQ